MDSWSVMSFIVNIGAVRNIKNPEEKLVVNFNFTVLICYVCVFCISRFMCSAILIFWLFVSMITVYTRV